MISRIRSIRNRHLEDEILDFLPSNDPSAIRSRRDLRLINFLMGNIRWIQSCVKNNNEISHITELGAGDGALLSNLAGRGLKLTGIDLQPKPENLSSDIGWGQLDVTKTDTSYFNNTVVAVLFLHHLSESQLIELGEKIRLGKFLYVVEPHRCFFSILQGYTLFPFVNQVTRHDMMVSIKAGFKMGELPEILGLDQNKGWSYSEHITPLGAYRLSARRN